MILYEKKVFKKDKKGNWRENNVSVIKSKDQVIIRKSSGLLYGKKVISDTLFKIESTERAINEAKSYTKKKLDTGYVEEMSSNDTLFLPMLAQDFNKQSKKITYPALVQPKLDGVRCFIKNNTFYSRKNTQYYYLDNILETLFVKKPPKNIIWDGELYIHGMELQDLVSIVRQQIQKPDSGLLKKVKFIVYDCYDIKKTELIYQDRLKIIQEYIKPEYIIETVVAEKIEDVYKYHAKFTKLKYEGVMIRNTNGKYAPSFRSKDLQKYKTFLDSEFKIIDYTSGRGRDMDTIIFILETTSGNTFKCRPKGTVKDRKKAYKEGKDFIGKYVTVRYQKLNYYSDIPIFPVCDLYPREL